jgi:CxxC motif-containing protein (DUF1111 family)
VIPPPGDFAFAPADIFRTPPLWGVADSGPYLTDGSAATLDDAIRRHQFQAHAASTAYQKLSEAERKSLLAFLESLRAP